MSMHSSGGSRFIVSNNFDYCTLNGAKSALKRGASCQNLMPHFWDMGTLTYFFWEPWKTNFIFLHFRWYWYRFWCFFDFQGHHLFICCPIKLNYGNPEIENALMFLKILKNSDFTHFLNLKSSHDKNYFYFMKWKSNFSCF